MSRLKYYFGAALTLAVSSVGGNIYATSRRPTIIDPKAFDRLAPTYDSAIESTEASSGLNEIRAKFVFKAKGRVLEIALGTGRNFEYYDPESVREIVAVDRSKEMVRVAMKKLEAVGGRKFKIESWDEVEGMGKVAMGELGVKEPKDVSEQSKAMTKLQGVVAKSEDLGNKHEAMDELSRPTIKVEFKVAEAFALPYPNDYFDTVVDTFGICSMEAPEACLQEIRRVLKKTSGEALFLEHGRVKESGFIGSLLNFWLDLRAPAHAEKWGCAWNRDVLGFVKQAGFEITETKTHHVGTCTEIVAKKV